MIGPQKTLVHCVMNLRVSAFFSLYARKHLGWSVAQAAIFRAELWKDRDEPVWKEFVDYAEKEIMTSQDLRYVAR